MTAVPAATICGTNESILGIPEELVRVNDVALVTEPEGVVTAIGPDVAPVGTVTVSSLVKADTTVAATPLN